MADIPNNDDTTRDPEGLLRFNAAAMILAPSNEPTPGTSFAENWQSGEEGRIRALGEACRILDEAASHPKVAGPLGDEIHAETKAMMAATKGVHTEDTFHAWNWDDKPHRLLYGASDLMTRAADAIAGIHA
jgi:hypothetical protein